MKFPYKKLGKINDPAFPNRKYLIRPIIPIRISYHGRSINYEVLLDSGADFCIIHAEIAEYLGIPIVKGEVEKFGGIIGTEARAYVHKIDLTIGGHRFTTIPMAFSYDISSHGYGILGQYGFFNLFKVIFDAKKEQIEMRIKS